nr:hypothetical protein [Tanacetum cinerariifolium]
DRYNAGIRAINILLQGLPKDIYTLINHYTDAKDIWDNVKMLLEGSKLTKEDQESQLNIKMTMSRMQLNSKFVNNMLPEWGRFVTAVKLNRGLRDSNYDQLYAYLKQYEAHVNENKMMLDRFTQHTVDPLALMSNVSYPHHYSPSSSTPPSTYVPPYLADNAHLDLGLSSMDNLIKNLTNTLDILSQSYKTFLPQTNNQLRTSSNTRNQAAVQDGGQDTAIDEDVDEKPVQDLALNVDNVFKADDCDAFDFDVNEALTAQTMFMANLSTADPVYDEAGPLYDLDILSEDRHNRVQETNPHGRGVAGYGGVQNRVGNANPGQARQYVKDKAVPVVYSNVSYVPNDAYMMIYNDMYEPHAQSVSQTLRNTVVENLLTAKLATYKEQVKL